MKTYNYKWKELENAVEDMRLQQPAMIIITGWRSWIAYKFFEKFSAFQKGDHRFFIIFITSIIGILFPGIALISCHMIINRYSIKVTRKEEKTFLLLRTVGP